MSDLETLGARVRGIARDLPESDVRRAARLLGEAHAGLRHALRDSVEPAGNPQLARAREHLGRALSGLAEAVGGLDAYLTAIGVATAGKIEGSASVDEPVSAAAPPGSTDWWRQRVNTISDGDARTEPKEVAVTRLFSELVATAGRGDRDGYREQLLVAGVGAGTKLPGLAWPMIRNLAAEVLGHAPTVKDDDRLRRLATESLGRLLPKLPADVALAQLRGACHLPHAHRDAPSDRDGAKPHPVDAAATGPVLVAVLLRERERVRSHG